MIEALIKNKTEKHAQEKVVPIPELCMMNSIQLNTVQSSVNKCVKIKVYFRRTKMQFTKITITD